MRSGIRRYPQQQAAMSHPEAGGLFVLEDCS